MAQPRFYTGRLKSPRPLGNLPIPPDPTPRPEYYVAGEDLVAAVNVALLLGQPLLVTGEPGVGKTALAYSIAAELELGRPLKFETKSTSTAADLFYSFN